MASLVHWLHRLPEWAVYAWVVLFITIGVVMMPYLGRSLFGIRSNDDRSRGALEAYKAIVASLAFLLAFTLAQAQAALRTTETLVSQQAAALNTIDRSLLRYDSADFTDLRQSLHELTGLIIEDEWRSLANAQRSARAEAIVDTLSRRIRSAEATTPRQQSLLNELIAKLDEFTDKREELIQNADSATPILFWNTIAAIVAILVVLASFITPTRERILTIGGITAAVSLILCLLIIEDAPFVGGSIISNAPIQRVHGLMKARQRNPAATVGTTN
jgi:hypothetical protein